MAQHYPAEFATASDFLTLAEIYERSAKLLLDTLREPRRPESVAPGRLCAIHAVELYLNAFLRAAGEETSRLRGYQHDLVARGHRASEFGLVLRPKTAAHLGYLTAQREYLLSRYAPDEIVEPQQSSRLLATLTEIGTKVRTRLLA